MKRIENKKTECRTKCNKINNYIKYKMTKHFK